MTISRVLGWLVAAVIGAVFGVAGTIGQSSFLGPVPVGLLVAILGTGALLLAVRLLTEDRWAAVATGVGAMLATLVFSGRGPGGSVVVPAAGRQIVVLGLDDVVVVDTDDVVLVTTRARAQQVKAAVDAVRDRGRDDLL